MSQNRFKELVHYVCHIADTQKLGATKLNKILWFIDTLSYRLKGISISGEEIYIKRERGPVPRDILKTLRLLEKNKTLLVKEGAFSKKEYISLKEPTAAVFNEKEKDFIKLVVDEICDNHTANSISDLSHTRIWEIAKEGEEIPIYAPLADNEQIITSKDKAWADKVIGEYTASS